MMTDEDIKSMGLTADQATAIRAKRATAKAKFEATIARLPKLNDKAVWRHLETGAPHTIPAETAGTAIDIVKHSRATVLFESSGGNDWIQVGPIYQVGRAWRIIDAPKAGAAYEETTEGSGTRPMELTQDPRLEKMIKELTKLDAESAGQTGVAAVRHHLRRADILEQIVNTAKAAERDPFIRQMADSLSTAAQASPSGETAAMTRLVNLDKQVSKAMPGSNLAGYIAFRMLQADYTSKLGRDPKQFTQVQQEWLEKLTKFVQIYPKADDTPDAMLQLGMVCEFLSKDVEAKNWYLRVARDFSSTPQGKKGEGAHRRLDLDGRVFNLAGPLLSNGSTPYDIDQMRGKIVVVYFWASWNGQAAGDFEKLKKVVDANGKGVDVLCVNLDDSAAKAREFLGKTPGPGVHLYQAGGLEGKLATYYGIQVLPSLFIVGKDGKCLSKNAQISNIEEDVKKFTKK